MHESLKTKTQKVWLGLGRIPVLLTQTTRLSDLLTITEANSEEVLFLQRLLGLLMSQLSGLQVFGLANKKQTLSIWQTAFSLLETQQFLLIAIYTTSKT